MTNRYDECHLFGVLRKSLRQDLTTWLGFSNHQAGTILNWFDPCRDEYLDHVDEWQRSLCLGETSELVVRLFGRCATLYSLPIQCISSIHQVAKLLYKWHGNPRRETSWDEVKDRLHRPLPITLDEYEEEGIRRALSRLNPPDLYSVIGRFGPGATFEGYGPVEKWTRKGYCPDVPANLFRCTPRDTWQPAAFAEGITKIAEVPKSIKSNRIVSSERAMYMFAQLAVADDLVQQLHSQFHGHIFLNDADEHNKALYWPCSCSIDLSDASDHVSRDLVMRVLPQLWPVLAKVRSATSVFPDGDIIELGTFAPMGSGVCFPVLTAITAGVCEFARRTLRYHTSRPLWWRVYGDDIIVPVDMFEYTTYLLERAGLVVNRMKSCSTGVYRESCGRELLYRSDVTPAYIRDPLETLDAEAVESIASRLDSRFFCHTAAAVVDCAAPIKLFRYNANLQRGEALVRTTLVRKKDIPIDGYAGLNRWFCVKTQSPSDGKPSNLGKSSSVPVGIRTKLAWRFKPSDLFPYLSHWFATRC